MRFVETLWDLLAQPPEPAPPAPKPRAAASILTAPRQSPLPMQDRYDQLVEQMKRMHGVRVRKWRKSSSGCAWQVHYENGRLVKLIEAPYPRGPMSCAIFLHEIGHHAIGFGTYKPRCLEEYHAWRWSLETMEARQLNVTDAVRQRMAEALEYAVSKALRRGLRRLPPELAPYVPKHLQPAAASHSLVT